MSSAAKELYEQSQLENIPTLDRLRKPTLDIVIVSIF